jgi:hypothetical protein
MGYYTAYSLEVDIQKPTTMPPKETLETLSKEELADIILNNKDWFDKEITSEDIIADLRKDEGAHYALDEDGGTYESCKWYEWLETLVNFSKKYPNVVFTLSGEGEESGDVWKCYFKDGKYQDAQAKIVIEEYNPSKLK